LPQSIPLGLGGQASSPTSLVATPLRAPRCKEIQCPEHTTAGRTAPAGTRINPVSLVASTEPSRGRSQRSLLVSVGTTFRTDSWRARLGARAEDRLITSPLDGDSHRVPRPGVFHGQLGPPPGRIRNPVRESELPGYGERLPHAPHQP
jgi:hypothetical protein